MRRTRGDIFRRRALVVGVILALIASACVVKLSYIQLFSASSTAQAATASRMATRVLQAQRGTIVDTNGVVLAQSVESYTVYADQVAVEGFKPVKCTGKNASTCHQIDGKPVGATGAAAVAKLLAPVLGMNTMELGGKLVGTSRYVVLKKNVVPAVKRQIDNLHLSGVINYELTSNREYSDNGLLGTVLGGVDAEGTGVAGIEKMTNASLVGKDGSVSYQRGANGQEIPGTRVAAKDPVNGGTVKLTIDWDVQWYVKKALKDAQAKTGSAWGIAVVQRVKDGRIVAIADTDDYAAGSDEAKMNASKAITSVFEPGSTGKLITAAGLLQEGIHKPTDRFQVPYQIEVNNQTYHDSHEHGLENLTLAGILKESSNVGTVMASSNYSVKKRYEYISKFGIGQSTGLNFPGESSGTLTPYQSWDLRTRNTVLFGQGGYSASALQMTNVVATIANKGVRCGQSIIESSTDAEGNDTTPKTNEPVRVIDEGVASELMDMMESMASQYSGLIKVKGYRIAGKSGTAQVAGATGALTSHIGDFIAAIPADDPQFVITVVLKDPAGVYGGVTAGPVVGTIGEFLMQKYEVPASSQRKNAIPTEW
ncbi:peptidoglycan D,D-transpeptidase FtsI family protein [Bifidobacterium simiarum]|uniref:Cell division protein n=1 Tax=Bifidobacterium simiarum TaxID=2045441 RepID=A0A2M9HH86_9BIFI|nr:penicillin-binding protein 2 [Bifidobacterium simiarum]PJM76167.1 cell division protein [Bifidobacterium simiarum]